MSPVPTSTKTLTASEDLTPDVSIKSNGISNGKGKVISNGNGVKNGYSNGVQKPKVKFYEGIHKDFVKVRGTVK